MPEPLYPHFGHETGEKDSEFLSMLSINRIIGMDFAKLSWNQLQDVMFVLERWTQYCTELHTEANRAAMIQVGQRLRTVFHPEEKSSA